jgi:golgin subfamily B member 1
MQARKDELARMVAENVKLLGSLDAEKASHLERREMLLRATEEREKAVVEKSKAMTECQTLQVELRHCKGNLESMEQVMRIIATMIGLVHGCDLHSDTRLHLIDMLRCCEQRLAQANVELIKAQDALAERAERCDKLEACERRLDEMLAKTNQEVERLREALQRAEASSSEASKNEDDLRAKLNDAQLKMHEANGRAQGLEYELEDSKRSLETEITNGADKEAALNKEQAYCRSLEKELAAFKIKYQNQETELISVRESDRHHSMTMAELEVSLNTTRSSMSAEQSKLQQELILARLAVEQIFKAVYQKNAEVEAEKKKNEGSNEKEPGAGAGQDKVEGAEIPPADGRNSEAPDKSKVITNGHAEQSLSSHSISDMATMTCQHVHEMARKVMRLQQQNANLLKQVGQVEEVRMRADTLGRDKYLAEEELAKVRSTMDIQKTDLETVRKTKARLETELQAADAKVSKLNKSLLDMEAQHAKEQVCICADCTILFMHTLPFFYSHWMVLTVMMSPARGCKPALST